MSASASSGTSAPRAEWLDRNLGIQGLIVGDLILAEVLRGFEYDHGFNEASRMLGRLEQLTLGGEELAVAAAKNFRKLGACGVTGRDTADCLRLLRSCIAALDKSRKIVFF